MKQVNSLMMLCFIAAFFLVIASCSKTGPTGPAGATGPAGPAGGAGTAGATGAAGPAGTANVIYSAWLDASYTADTVHNGAVIDTIGFYYAGSIPKLTSAMLTSGEVKVYVNLNTAATPQILPVPFFDVYTNLSITVEYEIGVANLYSDANLSTIGSGAAKAGQWRYILIPGGTPARSAIDWNNYAEVKKYLNLKD